MSGFLIEEILQLTSMTQSETGQELLNRIKQTDYEGRLPNIAPNAQRIHDWKDHYRPMPDWAVKAAWLYLVDLWVESQKRCAPDELLDVNKYFAERLRLPDIEAALDMEATLSSARQSDVSNKLKQDFARLTQGLLEAKKNTLGVDLPLWQNLQTSVKGRKKGHSAQLTAV